MSIVPTDPKILAEIRALKHHILILEQQVSPDDGQDASNVDLVQLKPSADKVFGGLLLRVKKRTPWEVRGYLLLPRRSGGMETWTRVHPDEVTPVGQITWPEAAWGFGPYSLPTPERCPISLQQCPERPVRKPAARRARQHIETKHG